MVVRTTFDAIPCLALQRRDNVEDRLVVSLGQLHLCSVDVTSASELLVVHLLAGEGRHEVVSLCCKRLVTTSCSTISCRHCCKQGGASEDLLPIWQPIKPATATNNKLSPKLPRSLDPFNQVTHLRKRRRAYLAHRHPGQIPP